MAKKTVYGIGLLPSGRAIRVVKVDARRMLEINKRVGAAYAFDGSTKPEAIRINAQAMSGDTEKATITLCVRGIVLEPLKVIAKKRAATNEERAVGLPAEIEEGIDEAAMLAPYLDPNTPEFKRWVPLGEQTLGNEHEDNELSVFALFEDPREWKAAVRLVSAAGDGGVAGASPFSGQVVRTSATS